MNETRFKAVFNGLSSIAKNVYEAIPDDSYYSIKRIHSEVCRLGKNVDVSTLSGVLNTLTKAGVLSEVDQYMFSKVKITKKVLSKAQEIEGIRKKLWVWSDAMQQIAILFARSDSVYKGLPGCDVWDIDRDARKWPGGAPVVAHPPCRAWGRMRQFAKPRDDEKALALLAIERVRQFGGVLEHPAESSLWLAARLPRPGEFPDEHGGWTLEVEQFHFGHRAEKATWLYIVGVGPDEIPPIPKRDGRPSHCIRPSKKGPRLPSVTKAEREKTPADFATWLCMLASRCGAA